MHQYKKYFYVAYVKKKNQVEKYIQNISNYNGKAFSNWIYGNPGAFLVGILRIPVYHVDYTADHTLPRFIDITVYGHVYL